jgi:hypothetical protein
MKVKRWALGFGVSLIIGVFSACFAAAALDVKVDFRFWLFFLGLVGKDVILYAKQNPVEAIEHDTTINGKDPNLK